MADIKIVDGIPKPWTFEGTDINKPSKLNLFNFAVGQLAQIGSEFGKTIAIQSKVLDEVTAAVDRVQQKSAEIAQSFGSWPDTKLSLEIPDSATAEKFNAIPSEVSDTHVTSDTGVANVSDLDLIKKLISARDELDKNKIYVDPENGSVISYSFPSEFTEGGEELNAISNGIIVRTPGLEVPPYQLYYKQTGNPPVADKSLVFALYKGLEYSIPESRLKYIVLPKSKEQIQYYDDQLRIFKAAEYFSKLDDQTQVLPLPSDASSGTPPAVDVVTLAVSTSEPDAFIFTRNSDAGTPGPGSFQCFLKNPASIPKFEDGKSPTGSIYYEIKDDKKLYFSYEAIKDSSGVEAKTKIYGEMKPIVYKPTDPQKADWLSQYGNKIVTLTQRGGDQTVFLNALMQRYAYFFEAATNILKAFTSTISQISGNL